ncbi:MAG: radical SAM-associated putative lipoprotein [Bacteroidales bacterium]|nr:radical SAM-associated putative lipoprotein [Bacteroidales bacterium]
MSGIQIITEYDTSYSDTQGNFRKNMNVIPEDRTFVVQFNDIDGATNGDYESKEIMVDYKEADLENEEDEWYAGSITKKIDVTLNPKK